MIGSIDPRKKSVTIIGAGISGLLMGYTLKKRGFDVQIFEASERIGGLIRTQKTLYGPSEKAAHSLLVSPEVRSLFDELNIALLPVNKDAKARYIVRDRKMRRMPLSFGEIVQTLIRLFSKPKERFSPQNGTLADWCKIYLGLPALRFLLSPFVTGIFACTPEELNAKIAFPKLVPTQANQSFFRFLRSKPKTGGKRPKMMAVQDGMQKLVDTLAEHLKNEIRLNSPITDLQPYTNTNLVITAPTSITAQLLQSLDAKSADTLQQVRYSPLISITAFYRETDFTNAPPRGVGVLIPRDQGYRILGCLFNSSSFSHRSMKSFVSLTVMLGGTTDPAALDLSDEQITQLVDQELRLLLQTTTAPTHIEIARWPKAIPVYSNELKEAQERLREGFCAAPGRIIFSNFSKDVSIRGMIETLHRL